MTSAIPRKFSRWAASLLKQWRLRQTRSPRSSAAGERQEALPLGLEQAEVAALRQLLQSPPYLHYSAVLERVLCTQVDALLSALPHDRYLFQCGVVYATRRLIELPHDILAKVTELEAHANARDRAAANARDAQGAAFLNTPWWDAYVRDASAAASGGSNGANAEGVALG